MFNKTINTNLKTGPITIADVSLTTGVTTLILAQADNISGCMISNLAGNPTIRVGDVNTGPARGVEVPSGGSAYLEGTGPFYGYQASGSGKSVGVAYCTA